MNKEFIDQFNHTWNILEGLAQDFDDDSWLNLGHGYIVPARLAYHIFHSTRYYIEDPFEMSFPSGKRLQGDWLSMDVEALPSRSDILQTLGVFRSKTEKWLTDMDLHAKNTSFDWAGETRMGVVIFLMRHTLYHVGELNALLYESKCGNAEDNFIKAFR